MSALMEFLLARIAEREAVALAARNCLLDRWWVEGSDAESGKWWVYATGEKFTRQAVADHIALNDPTRVLAECEAQRRIIARVLMSQMLPVQISDHAAEAILRALVLPYADHPDYRQEWKP